jgi:hypothetical protein
MELLLTTIPKKHLSYKNYFKISKSPVWFLKQDFL